MMTIDEMIEGVVGREGGYSDHPSDRGGPTRWGVTQVRARADGYTGDMRELPRELAVEIYRKRYVSEPGFDRVAEVSELIAEELIDTGINMGPVVQAVWFQRWLNGFNRKGRDYADLFVDGRIGPLTITALRHFLLIRGEMGETVLHKALNCSQGHRYLEIAEGRQDNEDFLFGWVRTRVD